MSKRFQIEEDYDDYDSIDVEGEIVVKTKKAVLLKVKEEEIWLPLSQIKITKKSKTHMKLEMPAWLAEEKGLL